MSKKRNGQVNPDIPVTRPVMPPLRHYSNELKNIWNSHILTNNGEECRKLAAALGEKLSCPNIVLTSNGHMALELALEDVRLGRGMISRTGKAGYEVITTPFTFISTTNAILRAGFHPVYCDIDPETMTMDPEKIESLITDRTIAILPVHVYGNLCDVEEIGRIAARYSLPVIYDAAHAFGVRYKGRSLAEFGDYVCYSFHATKSFNTAEGGAVCCRNAGSYKRIRQLGNFGLAPEDHGEDVRYIGWNAKMSELHAALGLCNLSDFEEQRDTRRILAGIYRAGLRGIPGITISEIRRTVCSNYSYFPVRIDSEIYGCSRDEVFEMLKSRGIMARKYFYPLASQVSALKVYGYDPEDTPNALRTSREILVLPLYPELSPGKVMEICFLLAAFRNVCIMEGHKAIVHRQKGDKAFRKTA